MTVYCRILHNHCTNDICIAARLGASAAVDENVKCKVCPWICMYVRTYVCMYVRMYVRMYVCIYVCMYVRMYVCMYVCMYVRTYVRMYVRQARTKRKETERNETKTK